MSMWRFIPYSEHSGCDNMAIDEMLLQRLMDGSGEPTLRLYGFTPAAISIGLNQHLDETVVQRVRQTGIDIVRRPTGGRAVLHLNDLTYSFVALDESRSGPLKGSVTAAYKQICIGLIEALKLLGLTTELGETQSAYRHLSDCFLATTPADLQISGTKIAGSAQLRRKGAVLQHGSIPLNQDQFAMSTLLRSNGEVQSATAPLDMQRHINLFEALGHHVSWQSFDEAFRIGFESAFNAQFDVKPLTPEELKRCCSFQPTL